MLRGALRRFFPGAGPVQVCAPDARAERYPKERAAKLRIQSDNTVVAARKSRADAHVIVSLDSEPFFVDSGEDTGFEPGRRAPVAGLRIWRAPWTDECQRLTARLFLKASARLLNPVLAPGHVGKGALCVCGRIGLRLPRKLSCGYVRSASRAAGIRARIVDRMSFRAENWN